MAADAPLPPENGRPLGPIAPTARIGSLDALRGLAVLGILPVNIITLAHPPSLFMIPDRSGGAAGLDRAMWLVSHLLFEQKFITLFSMLFGAGLLMMAERAGASGRSPAAVHYRRMLWLLVFGLLHAYLVWFGDILVYYAICGSIVYPLRRLKSRWLIAIGAVLVVATGGFAVMNGVMMDWMRGQAAQADALEAAGEEVPAQTAMMREEWRKTEEQLLPTPEKIAKDDEAMTGSWLDATPLRAKYAFESQTFYFLAWGLWWVTGMMCLGAALQRLGLFDASRRPLRFHLLLMAGGYAVGLPIVYLGALRQQADGFDIVRYFQGTILYNHFGSFAVALGHVGLVMTMWTLRLRIARWLANVGRMALTNYLAQSVLFTLVFSGFGLGLYEQRLGRAQIWLIVLGIWAVQIVWSGLWLARFRMGPMEWLWRSLTYGRAGPIRRETAVSIDDSGQRA